MDISELEKKINKLCEDGKKAYAVVVTAGTTLTGSIDPILSIVETAKELW